jgi:hypothetical protein
MKTEINKTALHTLDRGAHFNFGGFRWVKLTDTDQDPAAGILALTVGIVGYRAFDSANRNDWSGASLRKWLNDDGNDTNEGFLYRLLENDTEGATFYKITSDLTADDGMKDYGTAEDYIALLTCDLYRQHRDVIPPVDDWYWTLTPWTCRASDSFYVRVVCTTGALGSYNAYNGSRGVRPLCLLKSDIEVTTAEPEPVEEPDTRKYTHCAQCEEELGPKYYTYVDNEGDVIELGEQDGSDNAFCSTGCAEEGIKLITADNVTEE